MNKVSCLSTHEMLSGVRRVIISCYHLMTLIWL